MLRLKNRTRQIPNGFRFLQPETGWQPIPWSSFDSIVRQLLTHRQGNHWLAEKHGWAMTMPAIEAEVDVYNSKLCQAQGWHDFIFQDSIAPPDFPKPLSPLPGKGALPAVEEESVGKVVKAVSGVKLLTDWLGSGMKPVTKTLAVKRSKVCLACPKNQLGDFWQRIEANVAAGIRTLLEIKTDLDLKLPDEEKLHSCMACDCHLPLKAWVPLEHIKSTTEPEVMADLDAKCWILKEAK